MIYTVRHRTTYKYDRTVTFARCVLRLTPKSSSSQTVLENAITIKPAPSSTHDLTGPFCEAVRMIVIETPHKVLVVEAISRVDVHAQDIAPAETSPAWETVRAHSFVHPDLGPTGPAAFVYPSPRAPLTPLITEYARQSFAPGRPIVEAGVELMKRIHADFTYDSDATTVSTPAAEAFEKKRGVCQDFAHIMISGLRGLGLPTAYVSGYLRTLPPPGQPRLEGADATHAWVSIWCGEQGWIGFDPTNGIFALNDHIVLAIGRDYSDVAPIEGIMLSPGEQSLKVEVDVIPDGETVVRPDFSSKAAIVAAR